MPPDYRHGGIKNFNNEELFSKSAYIVCERIDCTFIFYSILFYPITLGGRRGTTDEFATIPFHPDLFSAALVELAKSIPVHSLILSSHLFFLPSYSVKKEIMKISFSVKVQVIEPMTLMSSTPNEQETELTAVISPNGIQLCKSCRTL